MSTTLKFLTGRLTAVEQRIFGTEDYKEKLMLEKMISEIQVENKLIPMGKYNKSPNIKTKKSKIIRDKNNSPVNGVPWGGRLAYVYEAVEEILIRNKKEMAIPELLNKLKLDYAITFDNIEHKNSSTPHTKLISYVLSFNRLRAEQATLIPYPPKSPTHKRAIRYESIKLIGKAS